MSLIRFIPDETKINFVKFRVPAIALSVIIVITSLAGVFTRGLNYGIDFTGGYLLEVRTSEEPADLAKMRQQIQELNIGDFKLQEFGSDRDVMIRIPRSVEGDDVSNQATIKRIKDTLGSNIEYRRVETVGPKVSEELKRNAALAVVFALAAILVYIWFRFEWQFALCAILALTHDCIAIFGLYTFFGLEFNETAIIALLTTAGYSINDTVVIYDRIRENLRRYKKTALRDVVNLSINDTLSRTILTSFTTLLALLGLYVFGGNVIATFALPIICGITVGTYSSICVASLMLLNFTIKQEWLE